MTPLEGLAYRAWDTYYNTMMQRFGTDAGRSAQFHTNKHHRAFLGIATICQEGGFDVVDYLETVLQLLSANHMYVTPADCIKPDVVTRYREHHKKFGARMLRTWQSQITALTGLECRLVPSMYDNEEEILMCEHLPFYAWFRVVYPEHYSDAIHQIYGRAAWLDLQQSNELRKFLRTQEVAGRNLQELERREGAFGDLVQ